jgi:hypothetical protein
MATETRAEIYTMLSLLITLSDVTGVLRLLQLRLRCRLRLAQCRRCAWA